MPFATARAIVKAYLKVLFLSAYEQREVKYRRCLRSNARIRRGIGSDEHSAGAVVSCGAGNGGLAVDTEQSIEIDR